MTITRYGFTGGLWWVAGFWGLSGLAWGVLKLKLGWRLGVVAGCAVLGACGSSESPTSNSNGGPTSNTGGMGGSTSLTPGGSGGTVAGGNGGSAMSGATNGGSGGVQGGAGGTQGGSGGVQGGAGGALAGAGGEPGGAGAGGMGACAAPHLICDDFEKYAADTSDLSPDWITYAVSGTVNVDTSKPHAGDKSLHLTVEAGLRHYANLIRFTSGVEVVPLHHFGRMMVWLTDVPTGAQHWNLNMASGPFPNFPDEETKYLLGGMFGKLMSNYAQRLYPKNGDEFLLRGGGPQMGDAPADSDCAVAAPTQTLATGQWVCWEWEIDAPNATTHLWLDEVAMTEVDAIGHGTQCQGPGFNGIPMSMDYPWQGPTVFDKIFIGWEQYQDMPANELWIDDLVISTERVLCP